MGPGFETPVRRTSMSNIMAQMHASMGPGFATPVRLHHGIPIAVEVSYASMGPGFATPVRLYANQPSDNTQ